MIISCNETNEDYLKEIKESDVKPYSPEYDCRDESLIMDLRAENCSNITLDEECNWTFYDKAPIYQSTWDKFPFFCLNRSDRKSNVDSESTKDESSTFSYWYESSCLLHRCSNLEEPST